MWLKFLLAKPCWFSFFSCFAAFHHMIPLFSHVLWGVVSLFTMSCSLLARGTLVLSCMLPVIMWTEDSLSWGFLLLAVFYNFLNVGLIFFLKFSIYLIEMCDQGDYVMKSDWTEQWSLSKQAIAETWSVRWDCLCFIIWVYGVTTHNLMSIVEFMRLILWSGLSNPTSPLIVAPIVLQNPSLPVSDNQCFFL